ncbi:C6 zinc finger domain protein [Colletotrichum tofieldiae]|nr:C6 zinc finger domain protein [Colletotrichum tofieldiae]GKT82103.1 C6 zinc finger domain protein [Colletotrichum tofieldiae]
MVKDTLNGLNVTTIDIFVNNAISPDVSKVSDMKTFQAKDFSETMVANVYSAISLADTFMEYAPKYGGRVVNIPGLASKTGKTGPKMANGATNVAVDSYTRSFANIFASTSAMTFNSVVVGTTDTEALAAVKELKGFINSKVEVTSAAARLGAPDNIAYIVMFLASEEERWVTALP